MKPFTQELLYQFDGLTPESICVDAGSHEGNWSHAMWEKYGCKIVALEPIPRYIHETFLRLANTNATIIPMGLSDSTGLDNFKVHGAMSGAFAEGPEQIVAVIGVQFLMRLYNIGTCSVLKLNIEGGEYSVLECILKHNKAHQFTNIIVQPHTCVREFESRWKAIDEGLQKTHELVFHQDWCWSGYKLRS